jgi:hypothetical protein
LWLVVVEVAEIKVEVGAQVAYLQEHLPYLLVHHTQLL